MLGIPPMLETQRPLAMPANQQPEPRAPQPDLAKPVCSGHSGGKDQKIYAEKLYGGGQTNLASQKKISKTAKKKGPDAKPQKQGGRQ